jgi:hypothetical protein
MPADFSECDNNGNAKYADFADAHEFFRVRQQWQRGVHGILQTPTNFSECDNNGNAEYTAFCRCPRIFPSATTMATRSTRILQMPADFSECDNNGNAEFADFSDARGFSKSAGIRLICVIRVAIVAASGSSPHAP